MPLAINGHVSSSTTREKPKATAFQMERAANGSGAQFGKWYLLSAQLGYVLYRIYAFDLTRNVVLEAVVCTGLSAALV
jgi:V8-like Glu-specific endopeptidase